jgi:hypothetical protein
MILRRFGCQKGHGGAVRKLVLVLMPLLLRWSLAAPATAIAGDLDYPPTNYVLRSIDGTQVIGHSHITVTPGADDLFTVRGEYHFLNGDYDIDETTLHGNSDGDPSRLVRTHHVFYHPDGSLDRESRADVATGTGSCTIYENGRPQVSSAQLKFPDDTFAGDAVIVPLHRFLRTDAGGPGSVSFHDFNCIPGPQILKVTASSSPPASWTYYPGSLVRVDVEPDFGWINVVIAPFLPRIQAWFDPRAGWFFVGGESSRYYKGLKYMMVRATAAGPEIKAAPTPEFRAPPTPQAQPSP